ncbi:MAG: hypothetical protein IJC65_08565 [Oscillospiraceae bacterium]|nr:hypothetical protein [Oscillospiraceae bacterium]
MQIKEKKKRTKLEKFLLNVKILVIIFLIIVVGFFVVYMIDTSLDDVISNENNNSIGEQTTVYEVSEPDEIM